MLKGKTVKYVVTSTFILLGAIILTEGAFTPRTRVNGFTPFPQDLSGAELFKANCARCHGDDGKGGDGPDLTTEKRQSKWKDSDEKLVNKITNGGWGMPKFGKKLKPEEIKAIADYVRTLK